LYQLPLVGTPWIFYVFLAWESFFFFSCQIAFSALYTVNLFLSYVTSSLYLTFIMQKVQITTKGRQLAKENISLEHLNMQSLL
jgi:hypothetical protein